MNEEAVVQALAALKVLPRTGWMLRGVHASIAETVSMHSHEATLIALILAAEARRRGIEVDPFRAAAIAAAHDAAEAILGDLAKRATDAIGKDRKEEIELEVARSVYGDGLVTELIAEYVRQDSREARLAKAAETFSTLLQSLRYIDNGYHGVREILCNMLSSLQKQMRTCRAAALIADLFSAQLRRSKAICSGEEDPARGKPRNEA